MPKPVEWIGSSKADPKRFPGPVQDRMGFAIYHAQLGCRHRDVAELGPGDGRGRRCGGVHAARLPPGRSTE